MARSVRVCKTVRISPDDFHVLHQAGGGDIQAGLKAVLTDWAQEQQRKDEQREAERQRTTPDNRLLAGAEEGDLSKVRQAVADGACLSATNKDGNTALHRASRRGHPHVVEWLLQNGAAVNALNHDRESPLHEGAFTGCLAAMDLLLAQGADPNLKDKNDMTAIQWAVQCPHPEVYEKLSSVSPWKPDFGSKYGASPYYHSIPSGSPSHLPGDDVLFWEVARGNLHALQSLLFSTALDVNAGAKDDVPGRLRSNPFKVGGSLLTVAASFGHEDIVTFLLSQGADPNAPNARRATALHHAAYGGHTGVVEALLAQSDIKTGMFGFTASQVAEKAGHLDLQERLKLAEAQEEAQVLNEELPSAEASRGTRRL